MNCVVEHKTCQCGNEITSDYFYTTEEVYESCDVCGYFFSIRLTNKIENGNYPDDWKPKYVEEKGQTEYVVKIFSYDDLEGFSVCFCKEDDLEKLIDKLEGDESVMFFGITHKGKNGYKTQLFKI